MADFTEKLISINKKNYPTKEVGYIPKNILEKKLREINKNFNIFYINNTVCVATPYN